ncbi:MAG: ArsR/SmtB family transcription factor [Rhodoglobus sp.]
MTVITPLPVVTAASCCSPLTRDLLQQSHAESLARALKALADPARLRLLSMIAAAEDQEACVCDLTAALDIGQPTVSHHLKVLADAGFVTRSRRGIWVYYALVPGALDAISRLLVSA